MKARILNNPSLRSDGTTGKRFALVEAMNCVVAIKGKVHYITVPEGFVTDFASVPNFAAILAPKLGRYNRAAILHDYLYSTGEFIKGIADMVFLVAMQELEVKRWRREIMYVTVRYFGGPAWRGHRERDLQV